MSTETTAGRQPARRRSRRKLNTPLNLALAAILIALAGFWLGGRLQGDSPRSAIPAMPSGMGAATLAGASDAAIQGEITSLDGSTLYVSSGDGATVKVKARRNATVTRNAEARVGSLHPGDTVTVAGKTGKDGVVRAESVSATQSGVEAAMPGPGGAMPSGSQEDETEG